MSFQCYGFFSLLLLFFLGPPGNGAGSAPPYNAKQITSLTERKYSHAWHGFRKFLNAERGDQFSGMSELKKYFYRFGYLRQKDMNFTDIYDARFERAVTRYQEKLGLSVTGKLDSDTLSQIMLPRCGVPDTPPKLYSTNHYADFTGRPRWTRGIPMTLTYAFSPENSIGYMTSSDMMAAFKRAFSHWESVIPVTFSESEEYGLADIKIGFYSGDHGDGEAFDGVLGVLAHAFSPESGRFHLDAAETWSVDFQKEKSNAAVDLESVATHEIGHLLGLGHSSVKEAVMYPSLKPRDKKTELKMDDIQGIQALYGSNPNFRLGAAAESDISSNSAFHDDSRMTSTSSSSASLLLLALMSLFFL